MSVSFSRKRSRVFAAFGLPGVMSSWGFTAVRALARIADDAVEDVSTDKLDEFKQHYQAMPPRSLVLTSHYPEKVLTDFVLERGIPAVVLMENADDALAYMAADGNVDARVLRALSGSASCLFPLFGKPNVLQIRRQQIEGAPLIQTLIGMALHLGLKLDPSTFARQLLALHSAPQDRERGEEFSTFETVASLVVPNYRPMTATHVAESQLIDGILAANEHDGHTLPSTVTWPHSLFMAGDQAAPLGDRRIALAGGARCVIYGPYLHLPLGRWLARLIVDFDAAIRDQSFIVEIVGAEEVLARGRVEQAKPGVFALPLRFHSDKPESPIEIRIFIENGAIDGSISLIQAELIPLAPSDTGQPVPTTSRSYNRALP